MDERPGAELERPEGKKTNKSLSRNRGALHGSVDTWAGPCVVQHPN